MNIGYQMTRKMFKTLLDTRSEIEKKLNPYVFVMNLLNEQYGLKGTVKRITIIDEE